VKTSLAWTLSVVALGCAIFTASCVTTSKIQTPASSPEISLSDYGYIQNLAVTHPELKPLIKSFLIDDRLTNHEMAIINGELVELFAQRYEKARLEYVRKLQQTVK
jgi:hypothetical protein